MITCPECESIMRSSVCACGYRVPAEPPPMPDYVVVEEAPPSYVSYRHRWYAERKLPYQPPSLKPVDGFVCVGIDD